MWVDIVCPSGKQKVFIPVENVSYIQDVSSDLLGTLSMIHLNCGRSVEVPENIAVVVDWFKIAQKKFRGERDE